MRNPRTAFSLVELVATLIVLVILSSVAVPMFGQLMDKARESSTVVDGTPASPSIYGGLSNG